MKQEFIDAKGHIINLDSDVDGVRCFCPHCKRYEVFSKVLEKEQ